MQFIIDNLLAFIIAGLILFILASVQLRGQGAAIETTQFDAAKTSIQTVTATIDQDFSNIGAGILRAYSQAQVALDVSSAVKEFSFWSRTDPSDPSPQRITYRWREDGEVTLSSGDVVPRVSIERQVGNAGSWEPISTNTLTAFEITLRNENMNAIDPANPGDFARTRRIDVHLRMISPLGKGDLIEEVQWNRTIRPLNLQRDGGRLRLGNV